jgi:hypothetical protein
VIRKNSGSVDWYWKCGVGWSVSLICEGRIVIRFARNAGLV